MQEQNLYPKLNDFTNCLKRWQHRKLTLMGKITVIKTFALPKLIYPFTVLLDPPKEVIQKLNSELFSFFGTLNLIKLSEVPFIEIIKMGVVE